MAGVAIIFTSLQVQPGGRGYLGPIPTLRGQARSEASSPSVSVSDFGSGDSLRVAAGGGNGGLNLTRNNWDRPEPSRNLKQRASPERTSTQAGCVFLNRQLKEWCPRCGSLEQAVESVQVFRHAVATLGKPRQSIR